MAERLAAAFTARNGTVVSFDDHVGAGIVRDDHGDEWSFHCTRIADGTRTIATDTAVAFRVEPGPAGMEAVDLAPA